MISVKMESNNSDVVESKTNLIVNYLPQTITDNEFHQMFASIGKLKNSKIVRDRSTGYSFGFGFIDYEEEADAEKAIKTLNGLQLQNKRIKVAHSRKGTDENTKKANLYISGLPKSCTEDQLAMMFVRFGRIIRHRILVDQNKLSKGVGFVLYDTKAEADSAIEGMDGETPEGFSEPLKVKYADDNTKKKTPEIIVVGRGGGVVGAGRGGLGRGSLNMHGNYAMPGYGAQAYPQTGFGQSPGSPGAIFGQADPGQTYGYGNGDYAGGYGQDVGGYGAGLVGQAIGAVRARGRGIQNGAVRGRGIGPMRTNAIGQRFNPMAPHSVTSAGSQVLFVYNLGDEADEKVLWQLFSPFGAVTKVNVMQDQATSKSKGFGFVTMTHENEALAAIQSLNGTPYNGKVLQVSFKTSKSR